MGASKQNLWRRFQARYDYYPSLGLALDLSRVDFPEGYFKSIEPKMNAAFAAMADLERGGIANPDEKRMVGHYWLRNPALAPTPEISRSITDTVRAIGEFAAQVHSGEVRGADGPFQNLLVIGIGGSALGPQFVSRALGHPARDRMKVFFLDNTDPDGMDVVFAELAGKFGRTLSIVISKSGGTKETRNGMLETENAYTASGFNFSQHAVAITGEGSELDKYAAQNKWIRRFPMWDWVGGRTSETSAVGLLPAALQGIDVEKLLAGARACDDCTRECSTERNPSASLALAWYFLENGRGEKDMVVLPYKDRLELFSRYLQQLVMESLGKEFDLNGKRVNQGLSVFGNKGSTDQHAYVQQLRDGLNNFFVCFIQVLADRDGEAKEVEPGATSGDYLSAFFLGTRQALYENRRQSITLTLQCVSPFSVGVLIALFERAVGLYASLINVNAYNQPGVEAGKKAASATLRLQSAIFAVLGKAGMSLPQIAAKAGTEDIETVFHICEHLAANDRLKRTDGKNPLEALYSLS
jgi:glucose-6-phosphate isomerase